MTRQILTRHVERSCPNGITRSFLITLRIFWHTFRMVSNHLRSGFDAPMPQLAKLSWIGENGGSVLALFSTKFSSKLLSFDPKQLFHDVRSLGTCLRATGQKKYLEFRASRGIHRVPWPIPPVERRSYPPCIREILSPRGFSYNDLT